MSKKPPVVRVDLELSPPLPQSSFIVLFDPTPEFIIQMVAAFPENLVFVFVTQAMDAVPDYSDIRHIRVVKPIYLGHIAAEKRADVAGECVRFAMEAV